MSVQSPYIPQNCRSAFQLNWSLSVFGKNGLPSPDPFMDRLSAAMARDDLKILEYRVKESNVVQFFVSSQPKHSPASIIRSVKGRWYNVARNESPIEFRRNYHIRSVGSGKHHVLDNYVAMQNHKHAMADERVQALLSSLQYHDSGMSSFEIKRSGHGEFLNALHVVFESTDGWHETNYETLASYRASIIKSCGQHNWQLSRIALLSNHLHVLLSAGINDSPEGVAICLLNDLVSTQDMRPVFRHSFYVGTFGEFDRGAIWNTLKDDRVCESYCESYW